MYTSGSGHMYKAFLWRILWVAESNDLWLINGMKFGKIFWYWTGIDADHDYDDDDNEDNDDDDYYNHDDDMWHLNLPLNMEETSPNPLIQALL